MNYKHFFINKNPKLKKIFLVFILVGKPNFWLKLRFSKKICIQIV